MTWGEFTFVNEDGFSSQYEAVDYSQAPFANQKFNEVTREAIWSKAYELAYNDGLEFASVQEADKWYEDNEEKITKEAIEEKEWQAG